MIRRIMLLLLGAALCMMIVAQPAQQSQLMMDVAHRIITGNHEADDITQMRKGAATFSLPSLDSLADMREKNVRDKGERMLTTTAEALLTQALQLWGKESREAVECRRCLVQALTGPDVEKSFVLAHENVAEAEALLRKKPKDTDIQLLCMLTKMDEVLVGQQKTGDLDPTQWERVLGIEQQLDVILRKHPKDSPDLLDVCHFMAIFKLSNIMFPEYVNHLNSKMFPKGTFLPMEKDNSGQMSNVTAYARKAYEGGQRLWGDHDMRTLNYRMTFVYADMVAHGGNYDTLHTTLQQMEEQARNYLPEGDLFPALVEMEKWDCDILFNSNLYETTTVNRILRLYDQHYGTESREYLNCLLRLIGQQVIVNADRAGLLMQDAEALIKKLYVPADDEYGLYFSTLYDVKFALSQGNIEAFQQFVATQYDNFKKYHHVSWSSITTGTRLSLLLLKLSQLEQSMEIYDLFLGDLQQLTGNDSQVYACALYNKVLLLTNSDNPQHFIEGENLCREVISLFQKHHILPKMPLFTLNNFEVIQGKYKEGAATLKQLISIDDHADPVWTTHAKLLLAWQIMTYPTGLPMAESEQLFAEAKRDFSKTESLLSFDHIQDYQWLGEYAYKLENYEEAEQMLTQGLERYRELGVGTHNGIYVDFISSLYALYVNLQKTDKAEQLIENATAELLNDPYADRLLVLDLLWKRVDLIHSKGWDDMVLWSKAVNELAKEYQTIQTLSQGQLPFYYKTKYLNLAMELLAIFNNMVMEMEREKEKTMPQESAEVIAAAEQKWSLFKGYFTEILPILQEVEEEIKKSSPQYLNENSGVVELYRNYANYYLIIEKDTTKGIHYYQQLIQSAHPFVKASGYWMLSTARASQGRFAEAADLLEELRKLTKSHEDYKESLTNQELINQSQSYFYYQCGQYQQGLAPARNFFQLRQQRIQAEFDLLTQEERESFVNNGGAGGLGLFALLEKLPEQVSAEAYDAILAEKGLLLRASERIKQAVRQSGDDVLENQMTELEQLKAEYKKKNTMTDWMHDNYTLDEDVVQLKERIVALERTINRSVAKMVSVEKTPTWKDVQSVLREGEAAVEFLEADTLAGALVLLPSGEPQYVSLTSGRMLFLQLSQLWNLPAKARIHALYEEDRLHLYDRLWKPLESALKGAHTIYFSPINMLNELAFAAFRYADGSYLTDHYDLRQMLTTGELYKQRNMKDSQKVQSALLVGGVYYSDDQEQLAQEIMRTAGEYRSTGDSRGAINDEEENFGYLPYTQRETKVVDSLLNNSHVATTLLTGRQATEQSLSAVSGHSPSILHLSTHGFYVRSEEEVLSNKFLKRFPQARWQSMQRTGLVLNGANATWNGDASRPDEADGIVTANEVARLDLSHTCLAVLSACQTAVGNYTQEGVFGTHRGFKQAGVRSILATLWNVNDRSTAIMMAAFYKAWMLGSPMQEAMHEAIGVVRREYPAPFYWAPYVLMDVVQ